MPLKIIIFILKFNFGLYLLFSYLKKITKQPQNDEIKFKIVSKIILNRDTCPVNTILITYALSRSSIKLISLTATTKILTENNKQITNNKKLTLNSDRRYH